MSDDPYAERKKLTFAQAEGREPLPRQLALGEISQQLRSLLWFTVDRSMMRQRQYFGWDSDRSGSYFNGNWEAVLHRKHVFHDEKMADEFENHFESLHGGIKQIFLHGDYVDIFDLLQWLLEQQERLIDPRDVMASLEVSGAAYRLLDDGRTIVPIGSEEEARTVNQAFANLAQSEFAGARTHLSAAAKHLTAGRSADSIRESIHAVESVARCIGGEATLSTALKELKTRKNLHPALEKGFSSIYGFTNDEAGIRHPLLDDGTSSVDEFDAQFMLGACASFVSYLINRTRDAPPKK